jgi:hypothetical protein
MDRRKPIFTFSLLLVVVVGVAACERYDLEVQNKTDEVIDIYIDEFYEGAVAPKNYLIIRDLVEGEHYVEIFDLDENLIADDYIYLDGDGKLVVYDSYYRLY